VEAAPRGGSGAAAVQGGRRAVELVGGEEVAVRLLCRGAAVRGAVGPFYRRQEAVRKGGIFSPARSPASSGGFAMARPVNLSRDSAGD
jgi:hypothetical protein